MALADLPRASIPFLLLGEDQDAVGLVPDNCLVVGTHDVEFCCIRCWREILLCSTNKKQLDSCFVACINLRNAIHLTDEFLCRYYRIFSKISLTKVS